MSEKSGSSFTLAGVLFVVFLILKLCGVIAWSWWWVTAPLWMPLLLVFMIAVILTIIGIVKTKK